MTAVLINLQRTPRNPGIACYLTAMILEGSTVGIEQDHTASVLMHPLDTPTGNSMKPFTLLEIVIELRSTAGIILAMVFCEQQNHPCYLFPLVTEFADPKFYFSTPMIVHWFQNGLVLKVLHSGCCHQQSCRWQEDLHRICMQQWTFRCCPGKSDVTENLSVFAELGLTGVGLNLDFKPGGWGRTEQPIL